ncbi:uncharacterized protein LOC124544224 [Vanessa cardui]|uniref:uncharacterized protein LOC124544224 n=1 Tax=Vanessa cardui TaxID=171605 RepID=UPI001F147465|nr:uncharacterized protein LOC124544224 [Vanessa cardui]
MDKCSYKTNSRCRAAKRRTSSRIDAWGADSATRPRGYAATDSANQPDGVIAVRRCGDECCRAALDRYQLCSDITYEGSNPNRYATRELRRQRAEELIRDNRNKQDAYVNKNRKPPKKYQVNDLVYVIKNSQSTGKLDSGMRGPYKVTKALPNDRYEVQLLAGAYGKTTQVAATYMVLWKGEWTPETCAAFFEETNDDNAEQLSDVVGVTGPSTSSSEGFGDAAPSGEAVLEED